MAFMLHFSTQLRQRFRALALACMLPGLILAQGTVKGTITEAGSGNPLTGANIILEGTTLGASSNADGQFEITNVPAGDYNLAVLYIGYAENTVTVTVVDGETTTINLGMEEAGFASDVVVVSASRRAEKVTQAPATIEVISARQIENSATNNVGELLARQKGVDYVRTGVLGTGINVRGFNSAFNPKNLQMNDARISTLVATGLPWGAQSTVIKEDIERIEVILGPSAALYGPNAHNGLVNTISKDPRTSEGSMVAFNIGNQSQSSARFRHAQVLSDKVAFKVTGEYSEGVDFAYMDTVYSSDGEIAYEELDLDRNFDVTRGEAAVYYTPKTGHDVILGYGGSNANYLGVTSAGRNQIQDWQLHYLHGRYTSKNWFGQFYHSWSKTDSTYAINQRTRNYQALLAAGFSESDARANSYPNAIFKDASRRLNAELQYNNTLAGVNYIIGGQWQRDLADSKKTYLLDQDGAIQIDQFGFYGQLDIPFGTLPLKAVLAARADDHELYGFNFIPKAALLYDAGFGTFRMTYGKGIAAPTILNLSGNLFGGLVLGNGEGFTLADTAGNTRTVEPLKVETIQTIELGFKGIFARKLFVDVNGYYNISENFLSPLTNITTGGYAVTRRGETPVGQIIPGADALGFVLTYLNFGSVDTYGADLGFNFYLNNEITLGLNYSYFNFTLDEGDLTNDGNGDGKVTETDLPLNTPTNKATAFINYASGKTGFFGSVLGRWVQAYDFFSGINVAAESNPELVISGDPVLENARVGRDFNEGPLGDFLTFDLTLGKRVSDGFAVSFQVSNLFDTEVREFVASPAIGRLFISEAKFNF